MFRSFDSMGLSHRCALLMLPAALCGVASLQASPIVTASIDTTNQLSPGGYVASGSDLINAGSATLASAVVNTAGYFNFGGYSVLNDGSAGTASVSGTMTDASTSGGADAYVTYNLQGSASGYDIREVNTIAGWPDQRVWQTIQVDVATVGNLTFTPIAITNGNFNSNQAYRFTPAFGGSPGNASRLGVADSVNPGVTPIATGVTAIRIHILSSSPPSTDPGSYREFDVLGVVTAVPETAPWPALLVIGGVSLIVYWRRATLSRNAASPRQPRPTA